MNTRTCNRMLKYNIMDEMIGYNQCGFHHKSTIAEVFFFCIKRKCIRHQYTTIYRFERIFPPSRQCLVKSPNYGTPDYAIVPSSFSYLYSSQHIVLKRLVCVFIHYGEKQIVGYMKQWVKLYFDL
jgi:hypothetical protein